MSLAKHEFTNAGRDMLGRAQAGEVLHFTKIAVGSGAAAAPSDLWPLTDPINEEMLVSISSQRNLGGGVLLVEGSFSSQSAPEPFSLREVGVYAAIASETPRLYSLANVFTDPPDFIDPTTPTVQAFKIKLIVDRVPTTSIVVEIGPSEAIVLQNVGSDSDGHGIAKDAAGNVLPFKRLAAGPEIDISEDVAQNIITIGKKNLKTNVDLYVPQNYPGITDPTVLFPTVQAAHDSLLQYAIPPDKFANIHLYNGTFAVVPPGISFNHPDSMRIQLLGQPRVDKTVTSIIGFDVTRKDVTVTNAAGLAAAQRVYLANCNAGWAGGCRILSTHTNIMWCSVLSRDSRGIYTENDTATGRRLSYYPSFLYYNGLPSPGQPLINCPNGIGLLQNLTLEGGDYVVLLGSNGGQLQNCALFGDPRGGSSGALLVNGQTLLSGENVFCDATFGIVGNAPLKAFDQTYVNGCSQGVTPAPAGFAIGEITTGLPNSITYIVRCGIAVNCSAGGTLTGGKYYFYCNDRGLQSIRLSTITMNPVNPSFPKFNGLDLYAQGMGYIEYALRGQPPPAAISPVTSPGNQNAYIYLL